MKNINYIDKIVSESIGDMKMPVEKNWQDMSEILNNLPKAEVVNSGFLSSITAKIIAGITLITTIITAFFIFTPADNNQNTNTIQKPVDVKIEITSTREFVTVESGFDDSIEIIAENNQNDNQIADNQVVENQNDVVEQKDTSVTEIVIINIEQTLIDTIRR